VKKEKNPRHKGPGEGSKDLRRHKGNKEFKNANDEGRTLIKTRRKEFVYWGDRQSDRIAAYPCQTEEVSNLIKGKKIRN